MKQNMKQISTKDLTLEAIRNGNFQSIERNKYLPFKMKVALSVVEAIGKSRNANFVIDDENRFAYEQTIKWVHGDTSMKALNPETGKQEAGNINAGLFIGGTTGTGKSWLLEIMAAYTTIDKVEIYFNGKKHALNWSYYTYRAAEICDEYARKGDISRFKQAPILAIQDLGSEPEEAVYMGNRLQVLKQILEYRGDRKDLLTLITSNSPIGSKELLTRYGDRVNSRLHEMCNFLIMKGTDRRIAG